MAKNFVMDEFGKIALEKGWLKKADVAPWQDLPKSYQKEDNIPPYLTDEQKKQWELEQQKSVMPKTKQQKVKQPIRQSPQMMNVINSVQWILKNSTKMPVSNPQGKYQGNPDGLWGAFSAASWNSYLEINPMLSQYIKKADPSGKKVPSVVELKFLVDEWAPYIEKIQSKSIKKEPKVQKEVEAPVSKKQIPVAKVPRQAVPIGAYDIEDVGINQQQFKRMKDFLFTGGKPKELSPGMLKDYRLLYPYGHRVENGKIIPIEPTAADDMVEANRNNNLFKEAEMPLTQQQEQVLKSIMTLKNLNFTDALEYAKGKYPRVFSSKPLPTPKLSPSEELGFKPQTPSWSKDPWDPKTWGIEQPGTMAGKERTLPVGEDVLKNVEKKVQEQYPEFKMNNDGLFYAAKKVIDELVSLANDLDDMGEEKAALAVDKQLKIYKSAVDKLYDITGETGDDLINQAHPGGGPTLFKVNDEGGKVETIIEEHKKVVEKTNKAPTGKYAEVINKLVATANMLEDKKEFEAAANIDKTIAELWKQFPFVNRSLAFEAASSEDNKASLVKKAEKFSSQKQIWDDIINNYYNPLQKEIFSFLWQKALDFSNISMSEVDKLRTRFKSAEFQKNRVTDSWGFADNNKMEELVNNFTKTLDLGDKTFWFMSHAFVGSEKEHKYTNLYEEMVKKLYILSDSFKQVPVAEKQEVSKRPAKKEKELSIKERYRKQYLNNVIGTTNKIIDLLNNKTGQAVKFLGNIDDVQQLADELKQVKNNVNNETDVKKIINLNKNLWRVYLKLQRKLASDINNKLIKTSASVLERLMSEPDEEKKQAPTSKRPSRGVRRDPNVIRLQTALEAAGFSPGKIDGIWGPRTAMAYNSFIDKMNLDKYLKQVVNPRTQKDSDKSFVDIAKAVNLAEYVAKKQTGTVNQIQLPGFPSKISLNNLKDPETFINYMRYSLGSKNFTPDAALQYLQEISNYLDENEMEMVNKDPGSVSRWRSSIDSLSREFQKYRGQNIPGQQDQKQQGQQGKEGPAPNGYRILNAQDFINKINRLPDVNGLLSEMMFKESARLDPSGPLEPKEYFKKLKEQIAYLYNYWESNFRFMTDAGSRVNEIKEKLLRYVGALNYISKNPEKFFGGGPSYINPKDYLTR